MIVNCETCNKDFNKDLNSIKKSKHNFCSIDCKHAWQQSNKVEFKCDVCNKEFYVPKSKSHGKNHYCSKECQKIGYKGDVVYNYNGVICKCDNCGIEYEKDRCMYIQNKNNFCSKECYFKYKKDNAKGASLTVLLRVTPKALQWKKDILKRDDYTCQKCGEDQYIQIHHIKHFSKLVKELNIKTLEEGEKCEALWDLDNGISLCVECHAGEHGDLFYLFKDKLDKKINKEDNNE